MSQAATAVSNVSAFSRIRQAVNEFVQSIKTSREIHRTYKELNRLSDSELRDIGIHRSEIASIAMEPYYNSRKARQ
jgi:uncharacterized protein YjiS (DUF1127 family)